ncbi:YigZ family protein [Hyunsoonleella sp. SJ7]|uniref:YigZ family protein n=1 Tax=Hyunsoonleella aquatilis TaxID=2762758 RepID=A0A923H9G2_9FLAO|nr:YigZ family protein [Hyunsoonleella aquatilis]MBC3759751.1 YigZ family protein [Hyunsoonleella aquatilis]
MKDKDTYKTITSNPEPILFKEKNSKFFGYVFPVLNETEVKLNLDKVKKEHHSARHCCYAYQIGTEQTIFRANDDGEPSNSAGMPIYGQIQSFELTNVLVIVVRYFGGVKLGVSGLIHAYKTTAELVLESCVIVEKTINNQYQLSFEYKDMNKVMRIIKEHQLQIISQQLELRCNITISVRKRDALKIYDLFDHIFGVDIKKL